MDGKAKMTDYIENVKSCAAILAEEKTSYYFRPLMEKLKKHNPKF